jgi:hypothetical protein
VPVLRLSDVAAEEEQGQPDTSTAEQPSPSASTTQPTTPPVTAQPQVDVSTQHQGTLPVSPKHEVVSPVPIVATESAPAPITTTPATVVEPVPSTVLEMPAQAVRAEKDAGEDTTPGTTGTKPLAGLEQRASAASAPRAATVPPIVDLHDTSESVPIVHTEPKADLAPSSVPVPSMEPSTDAAPLRSLDTTFVEPPDIWEAAAQTKDKPTPRTAAKELPATPVSEPPAPVTTPWVSITNNSNAPVPPTSTPTPAAPVAQTGTLQKPSKQGTNLDALRERVMNQSMGTPLTNDAPPVSNDNASGTTAMTRKKDLVHTDLTHLQQAHAAVQALDTPTTRETKHSTVSSPAELRSASATHMLDGVERDGGRLETKHAQAVADIARKLGEVPQAGLGVPTATPGPETNVSSTVRTARGAVLTEQPQKPRSSVPMIRTFRGDVEAAITHDRTSIVDMVSAQEKQRTGETISRTAFRTPTHMSPGSYILLGATVMLLLGVGVIGLYYYLSASVSVEATMPGIFAADKQELYDSTGKDRFAMMSDLVALRNSISSKVGTVVELVVTEHVPVSTKGVDTVVPVSAKSFVTRLQTNAPSTLIRSLNDRMMLGIYEYDGHEPFLIFRSDYYENTFSGMLDWERTMATDLAPLFGDTPTEHTSDVQTANTSTLGTTTATGTSSEGQGTEATGQVPTFEDVVIANVPARILKNPDGTTRLLWTMPDNATLIIATDVRTVQAVRERMTARTF